MPKQDKALPARRPRGVADDTLLVRSAESLGRIIGSLQRQLDGVAKKLPLKALAPADNDGHADVMPVHGARAKTTPSKRKPGSATKARPAAARLGANANATPRRTADSNRSPKRTAKKAATTASTRNSSGAKSKSRSRT